MGSRPKVLFAINVHARYTNCPLRGDMATLDRVFEHLVSTFELGMMLGRLGGAEVTFGLNAAYRSGISISYDIPTFEGGFVGESTTQRDGLPTVMINNDCNGHKTKHIVISFNLIRERVQL